MNPAIQAELTEVRQRIYGFDSSITKVLGTFDDVDRLQLAGAEIFEKIQGTRKDLLDLLATWTVPEEEIQDLGALLILVTRRLLARIFHVSGDKVELPTEEWTFERPSMIDGLLATAQRVFPRCSIGEDLEGQILIHTNLKEDGRRVIDMDTKEEWMP